MARNFASIQGNSKSGIFLCIATRFANEFPYWQRQCHFKKSLCREGKDFCVLTADFIWKGLSLIVSETSASEG